MTKPDREQIAKDLGRLAGLATGTGSKAEEMVARQIARNERLAAEEQGKR